MTEPSHDRRDATGVALATVVAVLLAGPFGAGPFNDDASYALTARVLAGTGHLTYNGWATAAGVAHAAWGAAWVRAFGFSFTALRLSTLPFAAAAVPLTHALARRAGLRPGFAVLAALTLGLSPLMLPLAASYMTDVPGLCFTLASLYALVRSADAPRRPPAVAWLAAGVVAGVVGGTGRQIVWVAPLAVVPYVAWRRRADGAFVAAAAVGWGLTVAAVVGTMAWFARQPFALAEPSIGSDLSLAVHAPLAFAGRALSIVPTLAVLVVPAAAGLARRWRAGPAVVAAVLLAAAVAFVRVRPAVAVGPWMINTLTTHGVLGFAEMAGDRPATLPRWACAGLSVAGFAVIVGAVVKVGAWALGRRPVAAEAAPPGGGSSVLPVLGVFAVAYVALLLPRCARNVAYDRYVLPLIPCAAVPLLLAYQRVRRRPSIFAWGLLVVWAGYAVGTTQEVLAIGRARGAALAVLAAGGVPPTRVTAGFDGDLWTELSAAGHLNSGRLKNPPGAYRPGLGLMPSIRPLYRLELTPTRATEPTRFGSVTFHTLLPPFRRRVYVDRFRDPYWLDAAKATTRPVDGWR